MLWEIQYWQCLFVRVHQGFFSDNSKSCERLWRSFNASIRDLLGIRLSQGLVCFTAVLKLAKSSIPANSCKDFWDRDEKNIKRIPFFYNLFKEKIQKDAISINKLVPQVYPIRCLLKVLVHMVNHPNNQFEFEFLFPLTQYFPQWLKNWPYHEWQ